MTNLRHATLRAYNAGFEACNLGLSLSDAPDEDSYLNGFGRTYEGGMWRVGFYEAECKARGCIVTEWRPEPYL